VKAVASLIVFLVALEHLWFMVLEMFLWTKPIGRKTFHLTPDFAIETAAMARNQGLYNGFLAAGLVWGLLAPDPVAFQAQVFFLSCVLVAGLFGAATVMQRIFFVQSLPALLGLVAVLIAY
jgi:putative membrane protein